MEAGSEKKIIFYKKVLETRDPQRKRTTDRNLCKLQAAKAGCFIGCRAGDVMTFFSTHSRGLQVLTSLKAGAAHCFTS